jgi:phosphoenolpyruvate phosphomutase
VKKKIFNFKRPYVFLPMACDFFHYGHLNLILKASRYGNIIIGLMTDNGIKSYKNQYPFFSYKQRSFILKNLKLVKKVIPLPGLKYVKFAKKYKFDFFIHGDDWKIGPQSEQRKKLSKVMKKWNGKVIDIPYTKGISSSSMKKNIFISV